MDRTAIADLIVARMQAEASQLADGLHGLRVPVRSGTSGT